MTRKRTKRPALYLGLSAVTLLATGIYLGGASAEPAPLGASDSAAATQARLTAFDSEGRPGADCPLEHTEVRARISGFLNRVSVAQRFVNPFDEPIEAVYAFPLPADSAVDDMTIRIGERTIRSTIKQRDEARKIYEDARNSGRTAALLDQERPNIFTQAVANIPPGEAILVEISYVERLRYEEGSYEMSFPMVVGPRYIPGSAVGKQAGGWAPDTDQVPDASRITPPVTPPGARAGHDISIEVEIDAGLPIRNVRSTTHPILTDLPGRNRAAVRLERKAVLPNKDFILRYDVAGKGIEDALLTHHNDKSGFFTLILQPPARVTAEDVTPKELVFVIDTSGSMSGFPIEKAKETMKLALEGLYPRDTFNLITFAGQTKVLFPQPVPATAANLDHAQRFLATRQGGGGTEMMTAIRTALAPSASSEHVRIVSFMTDGYVGNDMAILGEIRKYSNARIFSFGIGSSVNRFLLDKMAEEGRGEVEYVGLQDDGSAAARRFHERIRNPLLTDVEVDFGDLPVADVYPARIPDLFGAKPVVVTGRYTSPARGELTLRGKMSGKAFSRALPVSFRRDAPEHEVLATLWARTRVDDLMRRDYAGIQNGNPDADIEQEITQLGLAYRLMTQFTSFVAVEDRIVNVDGKPRRVEVPVEMPEGVSYEGVFGDKQEIAQRSLKANYRMKMAPTGGVAFNQAAPMPPRAPKGSVSGFDRAAGQAGRESETMIAPALERAAKIAPELRVLIASGNGSAEVQVWLTDAPSPDLLARLAKLGFKQTADSLVAKILIGELPISKIEELAEFMEVRLIKPR